MYKWKITKYNAKKRDEYGRYIPYEWTGYSDIGKHFENGILTLEEYTKYENLYVMAIMKLMEGSNISWLKISNLEDYNNSSGLKNGDELDIFKLKYTIKRILKEEFWCKLKHKDLFYVHFGYDYYMYIGTKFQCRKEIDMIKKSGLYIEKCNSPYYIT